MFPLLKIHYKSEKVLSYNTNTTLSGNNAMKFSTQVSEAHAAARVNGPDAADFDHEACIEAFQQLLSNSPWTHFSKRAADAEGTCTLFYGKGKYSC